MTGNAHRLFGLAFGASAGVIITPSYGVMPGLAVAAMALPGSTAPDWLEIRIGPATLIPHRTVTHWLLPWLGLAGVSAASLPDAPLLAALLFGFSVGGLSHVIGDAGTPSGVPVWHPAKRHSMRLWDGGTSEFWPVLLAWVIAAILIRSFVL
ncbi:metal-dependent hydrolase [Halomonas sp. AOP13-D3-9]